MPVRNASINREMLEDLYIIQNLSMSEITSILNVSRSTVLRRVKEFGLVKSHTMQTLCNKRAFIKKYGVDNPNKSSKIIAKRKQTNLQKYGTTCALQNPEIKNKAEQTNLEKYGSKNVFQSSIIKNKIIDTNLRKYGTKVSLQNQEVKAKAKETCIKTYGAENVFASESIKDKIKQTNLKKYGVENPSQNKEIQRKKFKTMKDNNSFNKSSEEDKIYLKLLEKFNNVLRQYSSKKYPYACDFYIPDIDLYIEYQGTWTHGKHAFNESSIEDLKTLEIWKSKNTEYYNGAIETWTVRDPLKRKTVKENRLNWIEFFDITEFYAWFNMQ